MAYSNQTAVSDGSLQTIILSIAFFDQSEIHVYRNGTEIFSPVDFVWATSNSIQFAVAVPAGVEIQLRRVTDISEMRHIFTEGAQFTNRTLDEDYTQILHIAQESREGATLTEVFNDLDMHQNKIRNLGDAVLPDDAVPLHQIQSIIAADPGIAHAIRAPLSEPAIPELVNAAARANKLLGFDAVGNPVATLPASGSGTELALDLADNVTPGKGAAMVGYAGGTVASALADLELVRGLDGSYSVGHRYPGVLPKTFTVAEVINGLAVPATANGAVGDGVTDDSAALNRLILALPTGGTIDGLGRTYVVANLLLKSRMRFTNIKWKLPNGQSALTAPLFINGNTVLKEWIYIDNFEIDGNRAGQTGIVTPGPEDGGLHGIRMLGNVQNVFLSKGKIHHCGSYGILLLSSTAAGPTDETFTFQGIRLSQMVLNDNRAHGGASDSIQHFRFADVEMRRNGLDLNTVDPLTSGTRGARTTTGLFGTGWAFEGYGLGSCMEDLIMDGITALGNAQYGLYFYDQLDTRPAGFRSRRYITISNSHIDSGVAPEANGSALTFSSTIASRDLASLYTDINIVNTRLDGYLILRGCGRVRFQGTINANTANYAILDNSHAVVLDVQAVGTAKTPTAFQSDYEIVTRTAVAPGAPTLARFGGVTGTLNNVVTTPLGGVIGVSYRYLITAEWTSSSTGAALFRVTPAGATVMSGPPRFEAASSGTGNTLPAAYLVATDSARCTTTASDLTYIQVVVDIVV